MVTHSTTALELDNPFWHYALHLWQQPGVEETCLELQQAGLSINRLLFCLWLGENGLTLPEATTEADHWQRHISHPQRSLRFNVRKIKANTPELDGVYAAMRKAELACEQIEIAWLYQHSMQSRHAPGSQQLIENNLREWLTRQNKLHRWSHPALNRLLAFTFPSPENQQSSVNINN